MEQSREPKIHFSERWARRGAKCTTINEHIYICLLCKMDGMTWRVLERVRAVQTESNGFFVAVYRPHATATPGIKENEQNTSVDPSQKRVKLGHTTRV